MQTNKEYRLKLSIPEKEKLTDLLKGELGNPKTAHSVTEYTLVCALTKELQGLAPHEVLWRSDDELEGWLIKEDELLLLARVIKKNHHKIKDLETLGEKIHVELLKTLLK